MGNKGCSAGIAACSTDAIGAMAEHSISPTPKNYWVWYEFFAGRQPELVNAIADVIAAGKEFTTDLSEKLFQKYLGFGAEAETVRVTCGKLLEALRDVRESAEKTGDGQAAYSERLEEFSTRLEGGVGPSDINGIVTALIEETTIVRADSDALRRELELSVQMADELSRDLEFVRKESVRDPLTGLWNRKYLEEEMDETLGARGQVGNHALLFIDIDHFKLFNDQYGHAVGDEVLKLVSRRIQSCVKGRDIPSRFGGEEFVVFLRDTDLKGAHALAEEIRVSICERQLKNRKSGESLGKLSVSIGAAEYHDGETATEFVSRADNLLYAAKAEGRNCVVTEATMDATPHRDKLAIAAI